MCSCKADVNNLSTTVVIVWADVSITRMCCQQYQQLPNVDPTVVYFLQLILKRKLKSKSNFHEDPG